MPELGKATYFLVANTKQFDAAMAHADEVSLASSNKIGRSFDRSTASVSRMGTATGVESKRIVANEEGIAAAATAESRAVVKAHGAAESSYVRMSATGTKAYERMKLGPLAAVAVTAYEGIKTFKENAEAAGLLGKAFENAGRFAYITRGQLEELTKSLEKNTLFTRAQIQMTERLALGYRDITDKTRFVKVAADAAAFSGKGLQMVTLALGRALENPAMGLGKLTRAGISFSPAAQAMAKQITETQGKAAGMAYVFAQVEARVRGSAKAAADNAPWLQLWKTFKEIAASMVGFVLPAFKGMLSVMNAHKTTTKVVVGALLSLAGAYVAVHVAQKAMALGQTLSTAVQAAYNKVTGQTAAAEVMRANAARNAMVQQGELNVMTEEGVAANLSLQASLDGLTASMMRTSVAGEELTISEAGMGKGKAGMLGMASAGGIATGAILATAAALAYMGKKAYDAWKNMKQSQAAVASDTNVALTAYAHEVNTLVGGGMDKVAARVKASQDVFNRLGIRVGQTFVDGVGHSITEGSTKLAVAVTALMKGLKDNVDSAMAEYVAAQQGGDSDVMKAAADKVAKAQSDLALGGQGATDTKIAALQAKQDKVQAKIDAMMTRTDAQLSLWRTRLSNSWGHLTDTVFQAFDAATTKGLSRFDKALESFKKKIQTALDVATKKIDAALKATMAKLQAQQDALTPAEARLKQLQDQASATQRGEALSDAQKQMASASTPEERAAAQRALRDAQLAITEAALQTQADAERLALNKQIAMAQDAAQKKADDQKIAYAAQLQKQQDAYEARINAAKLDYQSERDLYKQHLQKWLQLEYAWLSKHPGEWKKVFGDLVKVFGPSVQQAGKNIGRGFITTFRDAVADAASKSMHLNATMQNATVNLGKALAQGIVSGLRYLAPDLYNEMNTSLNKAIAAFKKQHGINSPARTTIEQIGMPLGEGIAVGIQRSTGNLFGSVRIPDFRAGGASTTGQPTTMRGVDAVGGRKVEIHQHITRTNPDPFQLLQEAEFAAEGVFG